MVKATVTISVDPIVWQAFKTMNDRKSSSLLENYMKSCINNQDDNHNLENEKIEINEQISKLKAKLLAIEGKQRIKEKEEEKEESERITKDVGTWKACNPLRRLPY